MASKRCSDESIDSQSPSKKFSVINTFDNAITLLQGRQPCVDAAVKLLISVKPDIQQLLEQAERTEKKLLYWKGKVAEFERETKMKGELEEEKKKQMKSQMEEEQKRIDRKTEMEEKKKEEEQMIQECVKVEEELVMNQKNESGKESESEGEELQIGT